MPTDSTIDSDRIAAALSHANTPLDSSECHGTLCGILCVDSLQTCHAWLGELFTGSEAESDLLQESKNTLEEFAAQTERLIKDPEYGFSPLLPPEQHGLQERTEAISHWCLGFLLGLSIGGMKETDKLPEDAAEIVQDLTEISRTSRFQVEDTDENEADYTELVEYLRAAVLLVYEEIHALRRPAIQPSPAIH